MIVLVYFILSFQDLRAVYLYHYDEASQRPRLPTFEDIEFEPISPLGKDKAKITAKNLNCHEFYKYALNCEVEAALIYNSSRKAPPTPEKIGDWCRSIKHHINCAIDWNSDCNAVTEQHFNDESIKGLMHVDSSVCDDEWFITQYDQVSDCISRSGDAWEGCYRTFTDVVDREKNKTNEWTHYQTHFKLCCARAKFRRCTFEALFESPGSKCSREHAVTLQKYSVFVSSGNVHQDCDHNMMYSECPGGDPRPSENTLKRLMNGDPDEMMISKGSELHHQWRILFLFYTLNLSRYG
ncbi:uncharacterized protein LOC101740912 [Bombyx mori]|uniref:Uncharacterized protein n=1 Tax=Bombyx mori TaxID=7091 RepID=A0A8R2AS14_BOMMO|nr:uncharacterized protein LOC101740912 [Bombyx mori]